ncbi:MAG: flagellar biosynthetic protein FliO [Betaproteobacteria bacterium]|nr:flagellar biosynthetic protein FliO [Betaproteobacteria bacterium]
MMHARQEAAWRTAGRLGAGLAAAGWTRLGLAAPLGATAPVVSAMGALQVLAGLALVLAAIVGTAWLLKRFVPGQRWAGGALRVVGGVLVGPKERVVLVEIGETWLVLGVAPGRVNALYTLPKPKDYEAGPSAQPEAAFPAWLKRALQGRQSGR